MYGVYIYIHLLAICNMMHKYTICIIQCIYNVYTYDVSMTLLLAYKLQA